MPQKTLDLDSYRETGSLSEEDSLALGSFAIEAKNESYSPYSHFRVGAALLSSNGTVWLGCNVENASYGGAICAERTAFVKAVSEGHRDFVAIAVVTDKDEPTSPCGICRQFMVEFGKKLVVYQFSASLDKVRVMKLSELLPFSFGPDDLK